MSKEMKEKLTEEQRAFRDFLSALFRVLAMIAVFGAGTIYRFTDLKEVAFYLLCIALLLIVSDNNYQHQLKIDEEKSFEGEK